MKTLGDFSPVPRAVFFDLDGTLIDSEQFYFECMRSWLQKHLGLDISIEDYIYYDLTLDDMLITHLCQTQPDALRLGGYTPADEQRIRDELMEDARARLNALVTRDSSARNVAALRRFKQQTGLKLALVSCSRRPFVDPYLTHYDLDRLFDLTLTGEAVTRLKPEPDIYLLALETLGLRPTETLVLEDAPRGIQAAASAGMRVLRPTEFLLSHEPNPDTYDFPGVSDALDAIAQQLSPTRGRKD